MKDSGNPIIITYCHNYKKTVFSAYGRSTKMFKSDPGITSLLKDQNTNIMLYHLLFQHKLVPSDLKLICPIVHGSLNLQPLEFQYHLTFMIHTHAVVYN